MDDERAPWSQVEESPSQESWRADAAGLRQGEQQWAAMPEQRSDWSLDEPQQQAQDQYQRHDAYHLPEQRAHYPADAYQLQLPADGVYDWQPGTLPDPLCPQHGYQAYPGFAGYPGYQDSQGYQTALANPLYDAQQDSDLYFDNQPGFADDDDINMCPLGSDRCRNMQRGFPTVQPIDDDDDDHPPGSPHRNK